MPDLGAPGVGQLRVLICMGWSSHVATILMRNCRKCFHNLSVNLLMRKCFSKQHQSTNVNVNVLVAQSCPTLCESMDLSSPGSSIHGILQAKVLEWVARLSPKDLPDPGIGLASPALAGWFFTTVPPTKPSLENSWLTVLCLRCPAK